MGRMAKNPATAMIAGRPARNRRVVLRGWALGVLTLMIAVAGVFAGVQVIGTTYAQTASAALTQTYYGANNDRVQAARDAVGLQQNANWCVPAAIGWIAYYRGQQTITQTQVANYLNSDAAVSPWGTPSKDARSGGPAFRADIARDSGADPRAHAAGLSGVTQTPYRQVVGMRGARNATDRLIADVVRSREPIAVIVDHGLHTVMVSGVNATGDPITNPGSVVSLVVWDPGNPASSSNLQPSPKMTISINTWLSDNRYWGRPYDANAYLGYPIDPDPAVGPYTYDPSPAANDFAHLWIGRYVYIRPEPKGSMTSGVSPDWPVDQDGKLIKGWRGEMPAGYTGPTTLITNKLVLADSSIDAPALWSRADEAPESTGGPASVLAWVGTDSAHHLNVSTSADGIRFSNKVVLRETSTLRPAIVVVPDGGVSVVAIAWIGLDQKRSINVLYDVYQAKYPAPLKITLSETSPYTPALTVFNGQLWLSWTGTDSAHTLNVRAMGPNGQTPGAKATLSGRTSTASPRLVSDSANNQLLLAWKDAATRRLSLAQSPDGLTWSAPAPTAQTSNVAPALVAINTPPDGMAAYQWAWVGTNSGRSLNVMQGSTLTSWQGALTLSESSPYGPALGYIGQAHTVILMWTGTDSGRHMNLAIVPV